MVSEMCDEKMKVSQEWAPTGDWLSRLPLVLRTKTGGGVLTGAPAC